MKPNLLPLALATGALIAVGIAVALIFGVSGSGGKAGGGGSTSTVEGYLQTVDAIETDLSTKYTSISSNHSQKFRKKQDTLDFLSESATLWQGGVTKLNAIKPPAEAAQAHAGLARATDAVSKAFTVLRVNVQRTADNTTALQNVVQATDQTAFTNYSTACQAVLGLATLRDISIKMAC